MQFHHFGYVSGDPRVLPAAGSGLSRSPGLPGEVDVLVVGTGPAGMITAAQLSRFPGVTTRIIDRRAGRLEVGHADGLQARSVETFQAFGFAERLAAEAHHVTEFAFWQPAPDDPARIVRAGRSPDDPKGLSEFPHILVNQARVLDYFAEFMANSPSRMEPDYGLEFVSHEITPGAAYPVLVTLAHVTGERAGEAFQIRAKYLVGADGAHSRVRQSIGCRFEGHSANHAWGVLDILANTDFPDIRLLSTIQSSRGNMMVIPREGGFLFRLYVDLGEVPAGDASGVRDTPAEAAIAKAAAILRPYSLDVKKVAWFSVYEVGHRLAGHFDDAPPGENGNRPPRVFIVGDACHTHSAKGGQGMNVSLQDGFNLGWKLGHVLDGRAPESLLATYSAERKVIAKNLIDFDVAWASTMAKKPDEFADAAELPTHFKDTQEFRTGFRTRYGPSLIVGQPAYQDLARGFPIGQRFASARVTRVADTNPVHLGHHATADGRWRIYLFADEAAPGGGSAVEGVARWLTTSPGSPFTGLPGGVRPDDWFDLKVIYQQDHHAVELCHVPGIFKPKVGPFDLVDYEHIYAAIPGEDIFESRVVDRGGAAVIVRPDQYVAHVLPLTATDALGGFFARLQTGPRPSLPGRDPECSDMARFRGLRPGPVLARLDSGEPSPVNRIDSLRRGLRRLYPQELLWSKYQLTRSQKLIMIVWGVALSQIASPVGSSIYFLVTQVAYQVRYGSTVTTLWYLKDTWDRLPVHVQNLLGQHWFASQAAPAWWVDARHDTRHVLIGLIAILLVRSLTIGFKENPRPRASTLRIILSPFAVLAIGTAVAAVLIVFFMKVFPAVMRLGFVSGNTWLTEWLGKDSLQLTLIGVVAGLAAKWTFDPVADTFQLMSIENQLAQGDTERWWWKWFYPPNYRARFAYLKASGHQPQRHGRAMGVILILSAPVFLFLLGFGVWLVYFGPAAHAH